MMDQVEWDSVPSRRGLRRNTIRGDASRDGSEVVDSEGDGLRRVAAAVLAYAVRDAVVRPPAARRNRYPWREFRRRFRCRRGDLPEVEVAAFFKSDFADLLAWEFLGMSAQEAWARLRHDRGTRERARRGGEAK